MSLVSYQPGDWIVFDGISWEKIENSDPMALVEIQAVVGELLFRGFWNVPKNEPRITVERGLVGDFYVVSDGGSIDLTYPDTGGEEPENFWGIGDWVIHDGESWFRIENHFPIDIGLIPPGIDEIYFRGLWDPNTNEPSLSHASGSPGHFYVVSVNGVFSIPESLSVDESPEPVPPIPAPDDASGVFGYLGKFSLASLVPGFDNSLNQFIKNINDVIGPAIDAKKSALKVAQKKVKTVQDVLQASSTATQEAQNILQSAEALLEEARNLTNNLKRALERAGIYSYYYLGPIGNFGTKAQSALSGGLPGSTAEEDGAPAWGADELVAVKVLIAGSDGGIANTVGRVGDLFRIIGGNASSAVSAFENLLPPD